MHSPGTADVKNDADSPYYQPNPKVFTSMAHVNLSMTRRPRSAIGESNNRRRGWFGVSEIVVFLAILVVGLVFYLGT